MSKVNIKTNHGTISIELFDKEAPKTVENFLKYVDEKFYDNTIFHRVIDGFMIQGGGFDLDFEQKTTGATIVNEADNRISNSAGTIAMARTSDPHSATAQFFINVKDNDFLDFKAANAQGFGYCVFAKVIDGMDTVEKIKAVKTGKRGGHSDVPVENVVIIEMSRIEE
ncbi:MAG: peptidylprolyl isomerase [Victivallaceae bacterium]|nr:peptidylprolyl isomerase [Victivallaceae bacterium]MDD4180611.1 peptidylprolyl isomerase [Victivallaceae bacterium]